MFIHFSMIMSLLEKVLRGRDTKPPRDMLMQFACLSIRDQKKQARKRNFHCFLAEREHVEKYKNACGIKTRNGNQSSVCGNLTTIL